jgi:hypothetical protein
MKTMELKKRIESALVDGRGLVDLHAILLEFAEGGGSAQEAGAILEGLRTSSGNERQEDLLLEALDYVRGFCSPQFRIWP